MSQEPSWQVLCTALRDAPMGIGVCDEDGRIIAVSTSLTRLLRRARADIIGRPFLAFLHPEDRPRGLSSYFEAVVAAAAGVRNGRTALRCLTGDDDTVSVEVTWTVTEADESSSACGILYLTIPPERPAVPAPSRGTRRAAARPAEPTAPDTHPGVSATRQPAKRQRPPLARS